MGKSGKKREGLRGEGQGWEKGGRSKSGEKEKE